MKILVLTAVDKRKLVDRVIIPFARKNNYEFCCAHSINGDFYFTDVMNDFDVVILNLDSQELLRMNEEYKKKIRDFLTKFKGQKISIIFNSIKDYPEWFYRTRMIYYDDDINSKIYVDRELEKILKSDNLVVDSDKKYMKIFLLIFFILTIIVIALYIIGDIYNYDLIDVNLVYVVSSCFALMLLKVFKDSTIYNESVENNKYSQEVQNIVKKDVSYKKDKESFKEEESIDALEYMLINLKNIKEFYIWSQKQAKNSFVLAILLIVMGLAIIIGSLAVSIYFNLSNIVAIVGTVGGTVTEFVAGTALVVYNKSLSELNYYHKSLHEDERFLSSVNLLSKFSEVELKDEMLKEIIRSEISLNSIKDTEKDKKE